MSSINTGSININYPLPGVNQNSQGFRDNFTSIKSNLDIAASELTDLQNKAILKSALDGSTLNNDCGNTLISNALTSGFCNTTYNLGNNLFGSVTVDIKNGDVQYGTITANTTLSFSNWPPIGSYYQLVLFISVSSTALSSTLTFPTTVDTQSMSTVENSVGRVVSFPASVTTLGFILSTRDCGANVTITPLNRPRRSTQLSTAIPATLVGAVGDRAGTVAVDSNYIYVCTANYDGTTQIWKRAVLTAAGFVISSDDISFLQSGTGSISRSVQSKLRERVSVKDFGAVGDGVTNDTTAILNALNSLTSGGALYFPKGTYKFQRGDGSAQLDTIPTSNILIYGDGAASKISGFNAVGTISNDVGGQQYNIFQATNRSNITIKDMAFEGYLTPVVLYTCTNVLVDNIYDNGQLANAGKFMRDKSVYINKGGDIRVVNSRFENVFFGVYVIGDAVTQASRVITSACSFEHTTVAGQYDASFPVGVYWVYSDACIVDGCTFKNIYSSVDGGNTGTGMGYGIYEGDGLSTAGVISNNTFVFEAKGNKNAFAIYLNEMQDCTVTGNTFVVPAGGRTPEVIRIDSKNQNSNITLSGNAFDIKSTAISIYCIAINDALGGASTFSPKITITGNLIEGGTNAIRQDYFGNAKITISGNSLTNQTGEAIQMLGSSAIPIKHPVIIGNTISGCGKNGIVFSTCISPSVIGNTILDGNTTNVAGDLGAAILFIGSSGSYIANNTIGNTGYGGGLFTWGVQNTDNAVNRIFKDLAFGNSFLGLTLGEGAQFGRYFTSSPTNGIFDLFYNDFVQNASIAAGGNPGWYAVKKVRQSLIANASSASTTVRVTSTTGMIAGDIILLVKDSNPYNGDWNNTANWHVDTVASVTNATDFVLTTGIPAGDGTYTSGVAVCHFARFKAAAAIAA